MLASSTGLEQAGSSQYQNDHMGKIFSQGFSFSGFERDKLYWRQPGGRFVDISGLSGLDSITDGRGAACADFDNDGDADIFLTALQGQAHHLFRNNVGQESGFIRVALTGRASGPDAFGAEVRMQTSQGVLTQVKAGGSGFVSQSDPRLLFGLGDDPQAEWLEVRWPGGQRQRFGPVAARSSVRVIEGQEQLLYQEEARFSLPEPVDREEAFLQALRYGPGDIFPAVALTDTQGHKTDFHAYRRPGKAYLVNLWATYCVPCRTEMPELEALRQPLAEAGVEVVGISLDMGSQRRQVPRFLERMGITYPVFTAEEDIFPQVFAGEQVFIPLSFIVDRQGRITQVLTGWTPAAQERIGRLVEQGE
ncbi:MAG: redoxin family protein [Candidatus Latescibacteria bacterium]|nr:redoxin family protein [Candidatus Latescibacterota bacterium]